MQAAILTGMLYKGVTASASTELLLLDVTPLRSL
jgi:hypothetical protein